MSPRKVMLLGLILATATVTLDLRLLRSFEFLGFPKAFAPLAPLGIPAGAWPPPGAVPVTPSATPPPARSDIPAVFAAIQKGTTTLEAAVKDYVPPPPPELRVPRAPTPAAEGATIVILDGLRVDHSREMPALNLLRARGEDAVVTVDFPCFSRVGYAGILTGALPRVHGYLANANVRRCPIPSVMEAARIAGVRTRLFFAHPTNIPLMFPDSFDEIRPLDDAGYAALASPGGPHLTVIYGAEPDHAYHVHGALSAEAKAAIAETDALVARIAGAIDLTREALVVTADHGHIDRGGHGGTEPEVLHVPVVVAGRGATIAGARSVREIAPRVAGWLGLPALPGAAVLPPTDAPEPRVLRLCAAFVVVFLLARVLGGADGPRPRDLLASFLAAGLYAGLYTLRGLPWSFSIANAAREVPGLMAQLLVIAAIAVVACARLARSGPRYAAATLRVGAVAFAVALAAAGPTASTAIDHPRAAYLVHVAATFLVAAGLLSPILVRLRAFGGWPARDD